MKRIRMLFYAACSIMVVIALGGCGATQEPEEHKPVTSIEEYAARKGIDIKEPLAAETTTESTQNEELQESTETEPQAAADEPTGNVLLDAEEQSKKSAAGRWGYVSIRSEELAGISEEEFRTFAEQRVRDSGYNWYTILCDDGMGVQFAGSLYTAATYGKVDSDGCVTEPIGYIYLQDGSFIFEE